MFKNIKIYFYVMVAVVLSLLVPALPVYASSPTFLVTVGNPQTGATDVQDTMYYTVGTGVTAGASNQLVITLSGQTTTGLTTAGIFTNNLPGVGTPVITSSTVVTIPFTGALTAGTVVEIQLGGYGSSNGLTNSATAGAYTETIAEQQPAGTTIETASTPATGTGSVNIETNTIAATVHVGEALDYTLTGATSFELITDPITSPMDTQTNLNTLSVNTNASSTAIGIEASQLTSTTPTAATWPTYAFTGTAAAPATWAEPSAPQGFGYTLSGTSAPAAFSSGTKWAAFTSSAAAIATITGPSGSSAWTAQVSYRAATDWTIQDGIYTSTITYVVTPTW